MQFKFACLLTVAATTLLLTEMCNGQGNCPDSTPAAGSCSDISSCLKDHTCYNGLCCPNCKRKAQDASVLPAVLKAFVPQCDPNGNYSSEQCQESTGFCWCVTEFGQEIPGTRITPGGTRRVSCLTERQQYSWQCPTPVGFGTCTNQCSNDADCAADRRKCCSNGCGKQCMVPVTGGTNPGPDDKPGVCPTIFPNSLSTSGSGDNCLADAQCFGVQKCCSTSLGKKCLNPESAETNEDSKAGVCPPVPSNQATSGGPRVNRCIKDSDCINALKCCDTTSGKTCLIVSGNQPSPVKPTPGIEQQQRCTGPNEEYSNCGDACPKNCDNYQLPLPAWCATAGCSQGCFCKPGFLRQNARDSRSTCVPQVQCSLPPPASGQLVPAASAAGNIFKNNTCPVDQLHTVVAQAVSNGQAQICNDDNNCPGEQKCCKVPAPFAFLTTSRCLCPDSNAIWKECGSACQDTCQTAGQPCSSIQCISGCFCVDGFVKESSNASSPCIPRNQCPGGGAVVSPNVETPLGPYSKAIAKLTGVNNSVDGVITFEQIGNAVRLTGSIQGLKPGLHGFHVHALGDMSNGCVSTGSHFDPEHGQDHGSPQDARRHAGDLGNIASDRSGTAIINLTADKLSLNGVSSVIGRTIVVHDNPDDLGRGSDAESKKTGNTGPAIACGVIGIVQ